MTPNVEQIIRSIQQLPVPEREKVRQWLEDERTSDESERDWQAKAGRSEKVKAEGVKIPFVELITEEEPAPFSGGWLS